MNTDSRHQLGDAGSMIKMAGGAAAVLGLGLALLMAFTGMLGGDWHDFWKSYLFAFMVALSASLGGLFFTAIQHITRAGWSVVLRRIMEALAANFVVLAVLYLPILGLVLSGKGALLFEWLDPALVASDEVLQHKAGYLNAPFFVVRAIFFFAAWCGLSLFFYKHSVAQDQTGDVAHTHRMQGIAPIAVVLFALTTTFAAIDWMMSLSPHWFSTMFGVYFFAISCCTAFSTLILVVFWLQKNGRLENEITLEHWQDMGKLLFAFGVVFHAYIGFSQFMLIWYANIPEETGWMITRTIGPWKPLFMLIAVGHFMVPFVLLVTKHTKRRPKILTAIAAWMLLMSIVDIYLIVMPHVPTKAIYTAESYAALVAAVESGDVEVGWHPSLMNVACLVGVMGVALAAYVRRLGRAALVCQHDPRMGESIAFENM